MEKIRVDGANGLRFSARRAKGCFTPGTGSPFSGSFVNSASESLLRIPKSDINPNKAVFTIESKSSLILIVNNKACQLLGYTAKELCEIQFWSLLVNKNKTHVCALAEGQLNSEDGTMVLLSGKVVEMITKSGVKVAASLWIRQIDHEGRCLAVAEPVERRVAQLIIDRTGNVLSGDFEALMLFQLESVDQFSGIEIQALIPAIMLPEADTSIIAKGIRKQKATGRTSDGITFPLCLMITQPETGTETTDSGLSNPISNTYLITIWVFTNLSGLIVIDDAGLIESCNHHFSMLMFGYVQNKILNMPITMLLPNFGKEIEYIGSNRSRNATTSSLDESETETDPVYYDQEVNMIADSMPGKICLDFNSSSKPEIDLSSMKIDVSDVESNTKSTEQNVWKKQDNQQLEQQQQQQQQQLSQQPLQQQQQPQQPQLAEHQQQHEFCVPTPIENSENNINMANVNDKQPLLDYNNFIHPLDTDLPTPVNDPEPSDYLLQSLDTSISNSASNNLPNEPYNISVSRKIGAQRQNSYGGTETALTNATSKSRYLNDTANSFITSTPDIRKNIGVQQLLAMDGGKRFLDGKYKGEAIHCDGNIIHVLYTISTQTLPCGPKVICVWIARDPDLEYDVDDDNKLQNLTLTFNSITSTVETSLGQANKNATAVSTSRPNSVSLMSQCEEEQVSGEFSRHYTTLKQIGKGAYGYVKMAYKNSDRLLVIAKFILKDKLCPQFMVMTDDKREVPMEIYLLTTVKHPNIVTVYDVFENEKFFQLVMEKHGSGMDLFEFIDRRPMIDEKLGCFIFRQIASAVDYLHSLNILHRDIKDENIIIDHNFHIKLIDFGSATFMEDGKLFATFFGTTEYCSPEVLAGNKYAGPELEMWSLGVTLYVLMFFENPFLDIEETLHADLKMHHKVSGTLETLMLAMLDKNPKTRMTMKQLMQDPWLTQELNPTSFNFAWIVPCEPYEANPEKYFTGQIYSSTTALSTTSPHDSLSLVDDDSMIDAEEENDDDDDDDDDDEDHGECPDIDSDSHSKKKDISDSAEQQSVGPQIGDGDGNLKTDKHDDDDDYIDDDDDVDGENDNEEEDEEDEKSLPSQNEPGVDKESVQVNMTTHPQAEHNHHFVMETDILNGRSYIMYEQPGLNENLNGGVAVVNDREHQQQQQQQQQQQGASTTTGTGTSKFEITSIVCHADESSSDAVGDDECDSSYDDDEYEDYDDSDYNFKYTTATMMANTGRNSSH